MAHGGCSLRRLYDYNVKSATLRCTFYLHISKNYCTCNVDCMVVMYAPFIPCVLLLAEYVQGVLGYNFAKIRVFEVACR